MRYYFKEIGVEHSSQADPFMEVYKRTNEADLVIENGKVMKDRYGVMKEPKHKVENIGQLYRNDQGPAQLGDRVRTVVGKVRRVGEDGMLTIEFAPGLFDYRVPAHYVDLIERPFNEPELGTVFTNTDTGLDMIYLGKTVAIRDDIFRFWDAENLRVIRYHYKDFSTLVEKGK